MAKGFAQLIYGGSHIQCWGGHGPNFYFNNFLKILSWSFYFLFYNLGCPSQRSVDTHTSTNFRETRNTLLACVPQYKP